MAHLILQALSQLALMSLYQLQVLMMVMSNLYFMRERETSMIPLPINPAKKSALCWLLSNCSI